MASNDSNQPQDIPSLLRALSEGYRRGTFLFLSLALFICERLNSLSHNSNTTGDISLLDKTATAALLTSKKNEEVKKGRAQAEAVARKLEASNDERDKATTDLCNALVKVVNEQAKKFGAVGLKPEQAEYFAAVVTDIIIDYRQSRAQQEAAARQREKDAKEAAADWTKATVVQAATAAGGSGAGASSSSSAAPSSSSKATESKSSSSSAPEGGEKKEYADMLYVEEEEIFSTLVPWLVDEGIKGVSADDNEATEFLGKSSLALLVFCGWFEGLRGVKLRCVGEMRLCFC